MVALCCLRICRLMSLCGTIVLTSDFFNLKVSLSVSVSLITHPFLQSVYVRVCTIISQDILF